MFFLRRPFKYTFKGSCIFIMALNCLVFLFTSIFPKLQVYLGLCPALLIHYKFLWQPATYMFIHGSVAHLVSNMLGLLFFGISLERTIGTKEFLLLYFVSGIFSGLFSFVFYILTGTLGSVLIGASGALYGILFAFAVVFPRANIYIWGLLPIPSPILILIYTAIELFSQFYGVKSNVAHFTHLFGFLTSYLYFLIRMGVNPIKVWKDAYTQGK